MLAVKEEYVSASQIVQDCRGKEFHAYGTTRIFERRARKLQTLRTWITFLGIVTPVIVGGAVLAFGAEATSFPYFLGVAGTVGIVQLVLSTWAIVSRWDEKYGYAIESSRENTELYNKFKNLADTNPSDIAILYEKALRENESREFKDIGQGITDKEKKFAYRESLKYYQKPCHICKETPRTSKPSKCDACGNF